MTNPIVPDGYTIESHALVATLDKYIKRNFGVRCAEHEDGCPICDMWAKRDDLARFICE
jgi:hypothetical protein